MRIHPLRLLLAGATLALAQTPVINSGGISNAASYQTPITPGGWAVIFGTSLSSSLAGADSVPYSKNLGGVTVQFVNGANSFTAPLYYVSPGDPANGVPSQID